MLYGSSLDLSRFSSASCLNIGCHPSIIGFVLFFSGVHFSLDMRRSDSVCVMYSFCTRVDLRHPIIVRVVSFSATSTFFAYVNRLQTGHAYSPAENHDVQVAVLRVKESAPHLLPTELPY